MYWFSGLDKKSNSKSKNLNNECFQYASTIALNYEKIKWNPERVANIIPFTNKYNWEGINRPSKIGYRKTFEKNYTTIALNILYTKEKKKNYFQLIFQNLT